MAYMVWGVIRVVGGCGMIPPFPFVTVLARCGPVSLMPLGPRWKDDQHENTPALGTPGMDGPLLSLRPVQGVRVRG
jgi:hypothetical protein